MDGEHPSAALPDSGSCDVCEKIPEPKDTFTDEEGHVRCRTCLMLTADTVPVDPRDSK